MFSLKLILLHLIHIAYAISARLSALRRRFSRRQPLPLISPRSKVPKHIAIVFAPNTLGERSKAYHDCLLESVYRCVDWCQTVGIERLTVYDADGILAHSSALVRERVYSKLPPVESDSEIEYPLTPPSSDYSDSRPISPDLDVKIDLHTTTLQVPPPQKSQKPRPSVKRRRSTVSLKRTIPDDILRLHIVSPASSKTAMADIARSLAHRHLKVQNLVKSDRKDTFELSISDLNAILEGGQGFPSPDLLIVHSFDPSKAPIPPPQLHGFPPWQTRLTEISYAPRTSLLRLPFLSYQKEPHGIDERTFRHALDEFSGAEMRLGK